MGKTRNKPQYSIIKVKNKLSIKYIIIKSSEEYLYVPKTGVYNTILGVFKSEIVFGPKIYREVKEELKKYDKI